MKEKLRISLKQESKMVESTPESFKIGNVVYYDELPVCTEKSPNQTVLAFDTPGVRDWVESYIEVSNEKETDPKSKKRIAWKSNVDGIENLGYGSFKHAAVVEYDDEGNLTKYSYDIVLWNDGAVDSRTETSTPGAVVVPIEKVGDNYYVHCFWQWRFAPWDDEIKVPDDLTPEEAKDFVALNRGEWFLTTPGGFASFAGETPEKVAKREAIEEAGLKVLKPVFERKNVNRANVSTFLRVGYSVFERSEDQRLADDAEKILGKMAVRIDKFNTTDAIVASAVHFAQRDLGLISSSSVNN